MVPKDFAALVERHARRAEDLADRFPACSEVLNFYAALASFQGQIVHQLRGWNDLLLVREDVIALVQTRGPRLLGQLALTLDERTWVQLLEDYWDRADTASPNSFFARVALQPYAATAELLPTIEAGPGDCFRCGHLPQAIAIRPQGQGNSLHLVCSLCLAERPCTRGCCPACHHHDPRLLAYHTADPLDHIQLLTCQRCRAYLHCIDSGKDPRAIAYVDELAALPLDVWAREQGLIKLQLNLAGI